MVREDAKRRPRHVVVEVKGAGWGAAKPVSLACGQLPRVSNQSPKSLQPASTPSSSLASPILDQHLHRSVFCELLSLSEESLSCRNAF